MWFSNYKNFVHVLWWGYVGNISFLDCKNYGTMFNLNILLGTYIEWNYHACAPAAAISTPSSAHKLGFIWVYGSLACRVAPIAMRCRCSELYALVQYYWLVLDLCGHVMNLDGRVEFLIPKRKVMRSAITNMPVTIQYHRLIQTHLIESNVEDTRLPRKCFFTFAIKMFIL